MNILSHLMIPADIRNFPEPRILYKNLYIKVLLVIGLPITVLYSIYHFHYSRFIEGSLVLTMFLSLCCLWHDFKKQSKDRMPSVYHEMIIRVFLILFYPPTLFNPDEIYQLKTRLMLIFEIVSVIALIIAVLLRSVLIKLYNGGKEMQAVNLELKKEIDENKLVEEALRKNEELFRLLTENANDVICDVDMDLKFKYISPTIEKILGWNQTEAISLKINDILTPHPWRLSPNV